MSLYCQCKQVTALFWEAYAEKKKRNKGPARPDPITAVVNRRCARCVDREEFAYLWILIKYFVRAFGNEFRVLTLIKLFFLVFEIKLEYLC